MIKLQNDTKQVFNWAYDNGINPYDWDEFERLGYQEASDFSEVPDEIEVEAHVIGEDYTGHDGGVERHPPEVDVAFVNSNLVTVPDWLKYKLLKHYKND